MGAHGVFAMQDDALLLQSLIADRDITIEEASELIGDSPLRLYRVLEGDEPLGRCAELALLAVINDLDPVDA